MRPLWALLAALILLTPLSSRAGWWRPWWAQERPAVVMRHGRRVGVAVGYARLDSQALTRDTAEARARKKLLGLLHASSEGDLSGARTTRTYTDWRGGIYAELEATLP